jgi:hypothetical protein
MASNYPGGLDTFTARSDGPGQVILAAHINALQDAVAAVEAALGVNPLRAAVPTYSFGGTATVSADAGVKWFNRTGRTITITGWDISATTAPAGADLIADVLKNGTTTYTTTGNRPRLTSAGAQTHSTATTPDSAAVADGDYLQVQLVQVGSTTPGANVALTAIYI